MSRLQAPGFSRLRLPGCANQSSIGKVLCLQCYFLLLREGSLQKSSFHNQYEDRTNLNLLIISTF